MFLWAKSASAATAALGLAGALTHLIGFGNHWVRIAVAIAVVLTLTCLILSGIRRFNRTNMVIVGITLLALAVCVFAGFSTAWANHAANMSPVFSPVRSDIAPVAGFFQAVALMFVTK